MSSVPSASTTAYWVFRGSIPRGPTFAWGTAAVRAPSGPVEPRLVSPPSPFQLGLPDAVGAAPVRTATTLVLHNSQRDLDRYLTGIASGNDAATEYTGPSFLSLRGQIFRGLIEGGVTTEEPWTPPLVVSGHDVAVTDGGHTVHLTLAADDDAILGRTRKILTARQLQRGRLVAGSVISTGYEVSGDRVWEERRAAMGGNLDTSIPWAYGNVAVPLSDVTADDRRDREYLVCVGSAAWLTGWRRFGRRADTGAIEELRDVPQGYIAQLEVRDERGRPFTVWVTGVTIPGGEEWPEQWLAPRTQRLWSVRDGSTAADVLRQVIVDHSESGVGAIDEDSWDAAARSLGGTVGAVGGIIRESAILADIAAELGTPFGLGFSLGADGKLRCTVPGWGVTDVAKAAGDLPWLTEADIFPSDPSSGTGTTWEEVTPGNPAARGASCASVWIEWAADQIELYPPADRPRTAAGMLPDALPASTEGRIPGSWVYPPSAPQMLATLASQRAYPQRRIRFTTHADVALLGPGTLVRVRTPHGLAAGGYSGRLLRLERADVRPAEMAAECTWEDLGPVEGMRVGVLDSFHPWGHIVPPAIASLSLTAGSDIIQCSSNLLAGTLGMSVWIVRSSSPATAAVLGSYRVTQVISSTQVRVDRAAALTALIPGRESGGNFLEASWVVTGNHQSRGPAYRPDRIRACHEGSGQFSTGGAGYRYTSHQ